MASILDNILNKNRNKDANSFLPADEQNLEEQVSNTPIVADGGKSVTTQENVQSEQSVAQPEVKYPNKPQALNDGEYEHLLKYYSPEAISNFSAPFDPSKGENILSRYYQSTIPKPTAPDEKKLRNRRTIAGIADGVGMLSQMISGGSGAHMRERNDSALSKVADMDKEEQNKYLQMSQRYNDGLFQSRLKDFQTALNDYNNGRKGIQGVMATKQKLDEAARQADAKSQYNYTKLAQDQANKDKDLDIKAKNQESMDRHRKTMEAQGWSRVTDSRNRTSAYVKKMSSSGSGKNSSYQMIFEANPNDTADVQTDEFGNKVKVFEMNKGQIDQYARAALSDKSFMNSPTGQALIIKSKGLFGDDTEKLKPNQDIAAAYLKEVVYNKQFASTPAIPSTASAPLVNWGANRWQPNTNIPTMDESEAEEDIEMPEDDDEFPTLGNIANF